MTWGGKLECRPGETTGRYLEQKSAHEECKWEGTNKTTFIFHESTILLMEGQVDHDGGTESPTYPAKKNLERGKE